MRAPFELPVFVFATTVVPSTMIRNAVFTSDVECCTAARSAASSVSSLLGIVKVIESAVGSDAHLANEVRTNAPQPQRWRGLQARGVAQSPVAALFAHEVDVPLAAALGKLDDVTSCAALEVCAVSRR